MSAKYTRAKQRKYRDLTLELPETTKGDVPLNTVEKLVANNQTTLTGLKSLLSKFFKR